MSEDFKQTAPLVTTAVAASITPLPFLAVYGVLFIARGAFRPPTPLDITTTPHGELAAGVVALLLLIFGILATYWFLSGKRRWPFVIAQAATLATAIDFVRDVTSGPSGIPIILIVSSSIAVVLAFTPPAFAHMRTHRPERKRRDPATRAAENAASNS